MSTVGAPDNQTAIYTIRVQGELDASWANRVEGMSIDVSLRPDTSPVTTLTGVVPNQEALESVLHTLYTLGLPLLSVEYVAGASPPAKGSSPAEGDEASDPAI